MPRVPATLYACLLGLCALVPRLAGLNICSSGSAASCEECLSIHPECAWCSKEYFGNPRSVTSRCDLKANLIRNGCGGEMESPASSTHVLRSLPLSSKGSSATGSDVIQMTPQEVVVSLRPGDQTTFQLQVRQVEDYPVDLYYLMDLSLSMKDDLDNIRSLGTKLAEEMRKLTSNFRLGFGSFVDKDISPFSYTAPRYQTNPCIGYKLFPNCVPSFGFRHLLPLTDRVDSFNEEVRKQRVSRNRDAPEGGFDAVLQAAVCKEKIGWRKDALHLLVFTTDDVPHIALDGKLGGLVQPHDGQCHLNEANEYTASNQMDYPSLALLGEKLAENNINLIFAVTKNHYMLYKNFTALIPGTTVEILHGDSKNIIQLIINAYSEIECRHPGLPGVWGEVASTLWVCCSLSAGNVVLPEKKQVYWTLPWLLAENFKTLLSQLPVFGPGPKASETSLPSLSDGNTFYFNAATPSDPLKSFRMGQVND